MILLLEKPLEALTFEEAVKKLEETIERMERDDLSLEETLNQFQEGIKLTRHCKRILQQAEQKIELLLEDGTKVEYHDEDDF